MQVSRSLVLVYGKEFNPKLVSDFEKLLLPLHTFLRVKVRSLIHTSVCLT